MLKVIEIRILGKNRWRSILEYRHICAFILMEQFCHPLPNEFNHCALYVGQNYENQLPFHIPSLNSIEIEIDHSS